jgi:hypothetical protein
MSVSRIIIMKPKAIPFLPIFWNAFFSSFCHKTITGKICLNIVSGGKNQLAWPLSVTITIEVT